MIIGPHDHMILFSESMGPLNMYDGGTSSGVLWLDEGVPCSGEYLGAIVAHEDATNTSRALVLAVFNAPLCHPDEVELPDDVVVGKT